jgi:hypothetical protein
MADPEAECYFCGNPNASKRCTRCKVARYCSTKCQAKHWKLGHKEDCRAAAIEQERQNHTSSITMMLTKSGIRFSLGGTDRGRRAREVELRNGRKIKLLPKEGADEFVDAVGTDFISTNLTAANDDELTVAYMMMIAVAENASPEKIASGIPESELRTFAEHTHETLQTLSTDRNWLRSGTVSGRPLLLLQTAGSFLSHPSFVKIFISNKGMEAVAKFYASRKKNDTPSHYVARFIGLLVGSALFAVIDAAAVDKFFLPLRKRVFLGSLFAAFLSIPSVLLKL